MIKLEFYLSNLNSIKVVNRLHEYYVNLPENSLT
jgi:hypothetical protein